MKNKEKFLSPTLVREKRNSGKENKKRICVQCHTREAYPKSAMCEECNIINIKEDG